MNADDKDAPKRISQKELNQFFLQSIRDLRRELAAEQMKDLARKIMLKAAFGALGASDPGFKDRLDAVLREGDAFFKSRSNLGAVGAAATEAALNDIAFFFRDDGAPEAAAPAVRFQLIQGGLSAFGEIDDIAGELVEDDA